MSRAILALTGFCFWLCLSNGASGQLPRVYFPQLETIVEEPATVPEALEVAVELTVSSAGTVRVFTDTWTARPVQQRAAAGQDYRALDTLITFTSGQTSQTVRVFLLPDNGISETEEGFLLRLQSLSPNILTGFQDSVRIRIRANDFTPRLRVASLDTLVYEGIGTLNLPVRLSGPVSDTVFVDYAVVDSTAQRGTDYMVTAPQGTLAFPPTLEFTSTQVVPIGIVNDTRVNGNRIFVLQLSNPRPAGVTLFAPEDQCNVILLDNDPRNPSSLDPTAHWQLSLYPNPARERIFVRSQAGTLQAELYAPTGLLLEQQEVAGGTGSLDLTRLTPGLYLLKLQDARGATTLQRIVVY